MLKRTTREGRSNGEEEAPVLRTEAKEGEKVKCAKDKSITTGEFERRKNIVRRVENEYFEVNPRKGEIFTDYALACSSAGREFSFYELGQRISWFHPSDSHGRNWGVNHNHVPILVRLCVEKVPACLPYIKLKPSDYDCVFAERDAYVAAQETYS